MNTSLKLISKGLFLFLALLISTDFLWPGKEHDDQILEIKKVRQDYKNAARNYHYSYAVVTPEREFDITEESATILDDKDKVSYTSSPVFDEVNHYSAERLSREHHRLRVVSGIIVPFLMLVLLYAEYKQENKYEIPAFVMRLVILADLIYLIL